MARILRLLPKRCVFLEVLACKHTFWNGCSSAANPINDVGELSDISAAFSDPSIRISLIQRANTFDFAVRRELMHMT
ncbi:hypothetical protein NL459_28150, partial [Klebsiella pneumoniae]|nr:hypothetical protein [Klebsiella pneumoniae]